jgi:hypothetical protein
LRISSVTSFGGMHLAAFREPAAVAVGLRQRARGEHQGRCASTGRAWGLSVGTAPISIFVYSCCGRRSTSSLAPSSTTSLPQTQNRHARDLGDHAEVVRDEQHPRAVARLQVLDEAQDLRLRGDVERGGRLVGDEQRRLEHQRHGDHDALALAAGELVRVGLDHALGVRQAHLAHDVEDLAPARRGRELRVLAQHLVELRAAAHHRVERGHRLLEHHRHARRAQLAQALRRGARHVLALEQDLPAGHRQVRRQETHHAWRSPTCPSPTRRPGRRSRRDPR